MKKIIIFLALSLVMAGSANAFSINIDPPSLYLSAEKGGSVSGSIFVENRGQEDIKVNAYTEDWIYAADRSKNFKKPGTEASSCSKWIMLYPETFTLYAGQKLEVKYTVTAPADASGGYYSVIFFESHEDISGKQKGNLVLSGRIGSIVYLDVNNMLSKKAEIEGVTLFKNSFVNPLYLKIGLKNTGNSYVQAQGNVLILDRNSKVYAKLDIKKFVLLQNEDIPVKADWSGRLDDGQYSAISTIDLGTGEPLSYNSKFNVSEGKIRAR